jgi:hypothetical protein
MCPSSPHELSSLDRVVLGHLSDVSIDPSSPAVEATIRIAE